VSVAVEAKELSQRNVLAEGLKMLKHADPTVEVAIQQSGEHVLLCAGELHLEVSVKC